MNKANKVNFKVHIVDDDEVIVDSLVEVLDSVEIDAFGFTSADGFF